MKEKDSRTVIPGTNRFGDIWAGKGGKRGGSEQLVRGQGEKHGNK